MTDTISASTAYQAVFFRLSSPRKFKKTAEACIAAYRPGWKNAKYADRWASTLEACAYPMFGAKHVRDESKTDMLAAIEPPPCRRRRRWRRWNTMPRWQSTACTHSCSGCAKAESLGARALEFTAALGSAV